VQYVIGAAYTQSGTEEKLHEDVKKTYDPAILDYSEAAIVVDHYTPDEYIKSGEITSAYGDIVKFVYTPETVKYTVEKTTVDGELISSDEIEGYYNEVVKIDSELKGYQFVSSDKELEFELTAPLKVVLNYRSKMFSKELDITTNIVEDEPVYLGMEIELTAVMESDIQDAKLQWQHSKDGENWVDEPGANDSSFRYELTTETAELWWRVILTGTAE
jgi:hypothetical protein